jgi:hypothetical protein
VRCTSNILSVWDLGYSKFSGSVQMWFNAICTNAILRVGTNREFQSGETKFKSYEYLFVFHEPIYRFWVTGLALFIDSRSHG